jgi:hypothetical protein
MASKAAAKNGHVLSSPPAASGIMVLSLRATTECEFDLAQHPDPPKPARTLDRNERTADAHLNFDLTQSSPCEQSRGVAAEAWIASSLCASR